MFKENSFDNLTKDTNKKPKDTQLNLYEEFEKADNERSKDELIKDNRTKEEIIAGIQKEIRKASVRFQEKEKDERARDMINSSKAISGMIKDIREKPQV